MKAFAPLDSSQRASCCRFCQSKPCSTFTNVNTPLYLSPAHYCCLFPHFSKVKNSQPLRDSCYLASRARTN